MLGGKDPTTIQGKPQESDDPYGQAPSDSGEEKLPFNRKKTLAEPGSVRGKAINYRLSQQCLPINWKSIWSI